MSRTLIAFFATQLLAVSALAQSVTEPSTIEFGRASSGTIQAITKAPRQFSGSLGVTWSSGALRGEGYDGTLGGELLDDRLWFFGTAAVLPRTQLFDAGISAVDAKATAQPVDWNSVTASFRQWQPVFGGSLTPADERARSGFLSLRSTSLLGDRMTLDVSYSRDH
jgi:hypothetical protein